MRKRQKKKNSDNEFLRYCTKKVKEEGLQRLHISVTETTGMTFDFTKNSVRKAIETGTSDYKKNNSK